MLIEKPNNDKKIYLSGLLDNKIKYTIIQDNFIDNCFISCVVNIGSYSDPIEYNGLAHFLEHMLFLGSKKYPQENYFDEQLKMNGGYSNAYTDTFETNYYYMCNNDFFEDSLDIFSRFFIDPLFDKNSVDREINAINSEHLKNINSDIWYIRQVILNLAKKDSPINSFSTGNLNTLLKDGVRDEMIKFYNKYYCSENICITILTPHKVNDVEVKFRNIFNNVPYKKCNIDKIIYYNNYDIKNKEYQIIPSNNGVDLNICYFWDVGYEELFRKNKNIEILIEVIENNHKDNIEKVLIDNNLANSINVFHISEGILIVNVSVINGGYLKEKIKKINGYVKYYFNNLVTYDWNKIIDFYNNKYNLLYQYGSKDQSEQLIIETSRNMLYFEEKNYINGNKIIIKKDFNSLKNLVESINFNNCNIIYIYKKDFGIQDIIIDKYYNVKYGMIRDSLIDEEIKYDYKYIYENDFYNIKPRVVKKLDNYVKPILYSKRKWYGGVSKFNETYVYGQFILSNHSLYNSIESYIITTISINVINYYLSEYFNDLIELGYSVEFNSSNKLSSLLLNINGFNDKYNDFFTNVINYLKTFKSRKNIIIMYIEKYNEDIENSIKINPWKYLNIVIENNIISDSYEFNKILEYMKNNNNDVLIGKIINRIKSITRMKNLALTSIFYGNIKKNDLPELSIFDKNYSHKQPPLKKPKIIDNINIQHPNSNEKDNVVLYSFYGHTFIPQKVILLLILSVMMEDKAYYFLRTKEQLGYLVSSNINKVLDDYYLFIKVQSKHEINYVKNKIDLFIDDFKKYLMNIKNNDIQKFKNTIKNILEQKISNTKEYFDKYSIEILIRKFMFYKEKILINQLDKVNKQNLIDYFNNLIKNKKIVTISGN
jgi:insulysin